MGKWMLTKARYLSHLFLPLFRMLQSVLDRKRRAMTASKEHGLTSSLAIADRAGVLPSQLNWLTKNQADSDHPAPLVYEYPLYSDARFTGDARWTHSPYAFLNTVPVPTVPETINTAVVLRAEIYVDFSMPDLSRTDETLYHGGKFDDEVVALASLCLGARLLSGDISREFRNNEDPYGRPREWGRRPKPVFRFQQGMPVLPDVGGTHSLDNLKRLESIPIIEPKRYISLVRACRLYRDALWVSESEPNLAWLLFVSALETGANDVYHSESTSHEALKLVYPALNKHLEKVGGVEHAQYVAKEIARTFKATKKFIDFVTRFRPSPPEIRPEGDALRFKWTSKNFKKMLSKVYGYRSRALHEGTPFPAPMFRSPFQPDRSVVGSEVPFVGLGGYSTGGTWVPEDLPINLHTFHYIARTTLLNWWEKELAQVSE